MQSVLIISGWAHGIEAIRPMANALKDRFEVHLLTGNDALAECKLPDVDFIMTGSMGGLLAMELLPASCRKLVLISSTAKFCSCEGYGCGTHEKILKRMIMQFRREPDMVLKEFYRNVHYPDEAIQTDPESTPEELIAGLEYLLNQDLRSVVPTIEIPTLLLHGREDRIIPPEASEWLHAHLPMSELKIHENRGHALPAHAFDDVMAEIRSFLI